MARVLAMSVAQFLNVPFRAPDNSGGVYGKGQVATGGGRLNIRDKPSLDSNVIAQAPNGATLDLISREGDWYLIRRNGIEGYVYAEYVRQL